MNCRAYKNSNRFTFVLMFLLMVAIAKALCSETAAFAAEMAVPQNVTQEAIGSENSIAPTIIGENEAQADDSNATETSPLNATEASSLLGGTGDTKKIEAVTPEISKPAETEPKTTDSTPEASESTCPEPTQTEPAETVLEEVEPEVAEATQDASEISNQDALEKEFNDTPEDQTTKTEPLKERIKLSEQLKKEADAASNKTALEEQAIKEQATKEIAMWRLYNPNSGEHFYTASLTEAKAITKVGWSWEGVGWVAPHTGDPVYRLYNPNAGDHHYTTNAAERDMLVRVGWRYEGIGWYSDPSKACTVLREYNPNAKTGTHNFTVSAVEHKHLVSLGWRDEGIGWYALSAYPSGTVGGFWLDGPQGNKAWIKPSGQIQTGYFEQDSSSYFAPKNNGWVVRGRFDDGKGHVYLADSQGHLATKTGWLVTTAYGDGMQRYYMEKLSNGAVAAKTGDFTVEKKQYVGIVNKGYVLRNQAVDLDSTYYWADNDGVLNELKNGKYGWQNPTGYYQVSPYNVTLPAYSRGIFSYVSPSQVQPNSSRADCVEIFVKRAQQYLGTPYVWDYACAPGVGVDCAGLVLQCLYSVGIKPDKYTPHDHFYTPGHDHYAVDMRNDPKFMKVSFAERKRGDLIFYPGHVAIYVGGDVIINAIDSQVQYDDVNRWSILSVSRVFI